MAVPDRTPASKDADTLAFVEEMFEEARREKRKDLENWRRNYNLLKNRGWSSTRPDHLPSPKSSEFFPTAHTLTSYMLDQYPVFYVSPSAEVKHFKEAPPAEITQPMAQDMERILKSWWVTSGAHRQIEMGLMDALTYGAGILRTGWEPSARNGEGDTFMSRVDPWFCLNDPQACSFEDSRYFIEVSEVPLYEVRYRFPERGHLVELMEDKRIERKPDSRGATVDVVSQMGNVAGQATTWGYPGHSSKDYTEVVTLITCWVRGVERTTVPYITSEGRVVDKELEVPYWERIVTCNGVVLTEDTSNPFDHCGIPYVRLPMVEIGEFWSTSLAEHIRSNVVAMNHLLAALQMHAEITGNPILLEPDQSGIARTEIAARPGGRLTTNIAATNLIRWLDPPRMGPEVMQLVAFHRETIDRVSGISAVARGSNLRRREAAAAVDAVQESSFVRVRAVLRNLEEALRHVGNQDISNKVQFYTEPRAIPIIGPSGSETVLELGSKHFWVPQHDPKTGEALSDESMRFDCWVQAGSSLPISRQARMAEMVQLFQMGIVDEQAVIEAGDFPNKEQLIARAKERMQMMRQMQAMEQGGDT